MMFKFVVDNWVLLQQSTHKISHFTFVSESHIYSSTPPYSASKPRFPYISDLLIRFAISKSQFITSTYASCFVSKYFPHKLSNTCIGDSMAGLPWLTIRILIKNETKTPAQHFYKLTATIIVSSRSLSMHLFGFSRVLMATTETGRGYSNYFWVGVCRCSFQK